MSGKSPRRSVSGLSRPGARAERELGDVLDLLKGVDDVDLIQLSLKHDGQEAIVKKVWPLDDSHSFVGLFDIAISVADLRRIHEQDLPTPDKPLADYDCKVEIRLQGKIPLSIMLRVRDNHELQAQFRRLLKTDDRFREAVQHCIPDDITCHNHVAMDCRVVASHIRLQEPGPGSLGWDIIT